MAVPSWTLTIEPSSENEILKSAIDGCGVTFYKLALDNQHGNQWFPNHAFIPSSNNLHWTDARTGETGDIVDLAVKLTGDSRISSARKILEWTSECRTSGVDPKPANPWDNECTREDFAQPEFPVWALPRVLRDMVQEMQRVEGLSPVLSSMCSIAAASASLGNKIKMKTVNALTVKGNLYMAASADSGTGKSTACNRAYKPIRAFEATYVVDFSQKTLPQLRAEADKLRKEADAADVTEKAALLGQVAALEARMGQPCITTSEATSEKLAEMMSRNGGAMAMLSGESCSAVDILGGRYRSKGQTDENFYLSAYSGDPVSQARITRGMVAIDNPCLTLLWLLQPDKFDELMVKPALHESGFLCRMLFCHSSAQFPGVQSFGITFSSAIESSYASRINELLSSYRMSQQEFLVRIDEKAWSAITRYDKVSRTRANGELSFMQGFVSRWGENTFRVALVFHAAEHGDKAHLVALSEATAKAAVDVVSWFAHQQVMLLEKAADNQNASWRDKVLNHIQSHPGRTVRDIGRGISLSADKVRTVVNELVNEGLLKSEQREGPGRTTMVYSLKKLRS